MEPLPNGGATDAYAWGQTVDEVTARVPVGTNMRAKDLRVEFRRQALCVSRRSGGEPLLDGTLWQPVLCDECSWTIADGVLEITLAKDTRRAENERVGPSSEWWGGLLDGTPALAAERVCVDDYVRMEQLPAEQRAALRQAHAEGRNDQSEEHSAAEIAWRERQARAERAEAALPAGQRQALAAMRQKFPDIPIEVGDTSAYQAPV